jgi:hypothetical protein
LRKFTSVSFFHINSMVPSGSEPAQSNDYPKSG